MMRSHVLLCVFTLCGALFPSVVIAEFNRPRIYTRHSWGANESFLYTSRTEARNARRKLGEDHDHDDHPTTSKRVTDCLQDQKTYPQDFKVEQTVSSYQGRKLRWARRYSPKIQHLVVHHTALETQQDERTGVEKIQALYDFHANKLGWGDIGYHYLIDEDGKIYEGRSGGDYVVGAHAYCHNVGTIGIAMLGNFEVEKPTDPQLISVKWLLGTLAEKYNIDPAGTVQRRGNTVPTIVGHGELSPTMCPGFYIKSTLGQIRAQVAMRNFTGRIVFPSVVSRQYSDQSENRLSQRLAQRGMTVRSIELQAIGKTEHRSRPGGTVQAMLQFNARRLYNGLEKIATVERSNSRIGIWQESGDKSARIRRELIIPERLQPGESIQIPMRFQMPRQPGTYSVDIGDITYTFVSEGRRIAQPKTEPTRQSFKPEDRVNVQTVGYRRSRAQEIIGNSTSRARRRLGNVSTAHTSTDTIRLRLSFNEPEAFIETSTGNHHMRRDGYKCSVDRVGSVSSGISTITNWNTANNQFRGVIECRILDGKLTLINELRMEDYMAGLAEQDDSQPLEKQKAFAIAARSYAAYYVQAIGNQRKSPGMPYDGTDSPHNFQSYNGYRWERNNPTWVRVVRSTQGQVLKKDNEILKAAYYSSNDGRTRSPAENGWRNFPHEEVFSAKPDPWCQGKRLHGHGVGMSGCGALGQAKEGKSAQQILQYYYPGTTLSQY